MTNKLIKGDRVTIKEGASVDDIHQGGGSSN